MLFAKARLLAGVSLAVEGNVASESHNSVIYLFFARWRVFKAIWNRPLPPRELRHPTGADSPRQPARLFGLLPTRSALGPAPCSSSHGLAPLSALLPTLLSALCSACFSILFPSLKAYALCRVFCVLFIVP